MASVSRELLARGHAVELAVERHREGNLVDRLRGLGLAVRDDVRLSRRPGPGLVADLAALRRLWRSFDVLHANFSNDHTLAWLARPRGGAARLVRTLHASRALADRALHGALYRRTDGLVAVCDAHARLAIERYRLPPERVLATRGAVDAGFFRPDGPDLRAELGLAPGQPVAGIVTRVKPGRGLEDLVEAFRSVVDALPEARLVVVGRGEGEEALRVRVAHRGLQREVVWAGYRTGDALAAAYRTFDVVTLLGEGNDGTCRALLEGMAAGRPGVAYRFGAPAEAVLDGVTGLLAPAGDVAALADALRELLGAPSRARALGAAARERMATAFTEAARGEALAGFLGRILALPPVRGPA
ncbi:MAG: glycosyltransferase family 4 protein [Anaeromyxobacteraceae bacterium]